MLLPPTIRTSWVSEETWCCLLTLMNNYFVHGIVDIYTDTEVSPITKNAPWTSLVFDIPEDFLPWRAGETIDSILISKDWKSLRNAGERGRVVLLTQNLSSAITLWTRNKLVDVVVMVDKRAYTWYPYSRNQCGHTPKIELVDTCIANCRWTKNLYPEKTPIDFSGCSVTYRAMNWPPNIVLNPNGTYRGRDVFLMETLAESFGFAVRYLPEPEFFVPDDTPITPTFAAVDILDGAADFVFGVSVFVSAFARWMQFLPMYRYETVHCVLPTAKPTARMRGIYSGISGTLGYLILISLCAVGGTIFWGTRITKTSWNWTHVIACFVTSPMSKPPSHWALRGLFLLFHIFCLHIAWFYQITLLKNLFKQPMEKQIKSIKEAADSNLVALLHSFMEYFRNASDHEVWDVVFREGGYIFNDTFDYTKLVKDKTAFAMAITPDIYHLRASYPDLDLSQYIYIVSEPYSKYSTSAFGVRGGALTKLFHKRMRHLIESGVYVLWTSHDPEFLPFLNHRTEGSMKKQLDLDILQGVFYLYFALVILSCFTFLWEVCQKHQMKSDTTFKRDRCSQADNLGRRATIMENAMRFRVNNNERNTLYADDC